jgi:hypothetical protein
MNRHTDCYRLAPLYEQLVQQGMREGVLDEESETHNIEAYFDTLRAEGRLEGSVNKLIGNDLEDEVLDSLWEHFAGEGCNGWWDDKPHQIGYRLLLRLTRAEAKLASLKKEIRGFDEQRR